MIKLNRWGNRQHFWHQIFDEIPGSLIVEEIVGDFAEWWNNHPGPCYIGPGYEKALGLLKYMCKKGNELEG